MTQKRNRGRAWLRRIAKVLLVMMVAATVVAASLLWPDAQEEEGRRGPSAVPVEVARVETATLEETVRGVGTLRAIERVEIRPEINGRIRAIQFEEGGAVEESQVLFRLDDEKLKRQLAARQAALRGAMVRVADTRRTYERRQHLYERQAASQDERDQAEAEYEMAQAEQEQAEAEIALIEEELTETRIRAPFDGVISEREVDRGAYVSTGDTLATVHRADPVEVTFAVPERHMGRVSRGQRVDVLVAAYPDEPFRGEAHFISPAIDEATRTFRVRARVPNPDDQLKPGAFATAVIIVNVREDRPVVPEEALVGTREGYNIFVVQNGEAHRRPIRTGLRRGGMVEVLEGVSVGDTVVRTGHLRLDHGDTVAIANDDNAAAPVDDTLAVADDETDAPDTGGER